MMRLHEGDAMSREREITRVLDILFEHYAHECHTDEPFRVLVSTIISQRTTDANMLVASKRLLHECPDAESLAMADIGRVAELIKPSGVFRIKAERLVECARILVAKHGGDVPSTLDELLALPGVGRKTANCVLSYGFGEDAVAVDTHVHRISNRLGITHSNSVEKTEKQIKSHVPRRYWRCYNIVFVRFGQQVCRPTKPRCNVCPVAHMCPSSKLLSG